MKGVNRMAVNTGVMYVRMMITMVVTLLSSRWVLQALGEEDFGIYHLVTGILSMLLFLNLTMATASQRFISFAIGRKDRKLLAETFYYSCIFHFVIGLLLVLAIESVGMALLNHVLQVPDGKLPLAIFCLHCLSVSTCLTVVFVPFNALLIAHENIIYVAVVQITEALLKLLVAVCLLHYAGTRLKLYAMGLTAVSALSALLYAAYCRYNYEETRFRIRKIADKTLFSNFLSYAGWNVIGSFSSLLRTQGISMLLNSFYGVVMNAAYGLATQVNGQLSFFSSSIVTAARPQIVKSEGAGDRKRMLALSATTCKFSFLLLSMIVMPLLIEMPFVLEVWLKQVPAYAVDFTRLIILMSLLFQFTIGVSIPIESVGRIKSQQIIVGGLHFWVIPAGYILLKNGFPPASVLILIIVEECIGMYLRLLIARRIAGLEIARFVRETMLPSFLTALMTFIVCAGASQLFPTGWVQLLLVSTVSVCSTLLLTYGYALTQLERERLQRMIIGFLQKLRAIRFPAKM